MVVTYNFLNLPTQMQFGNAFTGSKTIDVLYDASGRKFRKTVTDGTTLQYRQDYVGGIEYRSTSSVSLSLESIYHPEGRVFNTNSGTTSADALRYEYSIKDHLGNTRLNFTDKNGDGKVAVTTTTTNEILSESHYYPFGMAMSGPWMDDAAARDNQYKYNGKELNEDFGLGWYDYGARWYDASLGRWNVVDPMTSKYSSWSGYNYVMDNPTCLIDPDGMDPNEPKTGSEVALEELKRIRDRFCPYFSSGSSNWPPSSGQAGQQHVDEDGSFVHNGLGWVDERGAYVLPTTEISGNIKPEPFVDPAKLGGMGSANTINSCVLGCVSKAYYSEEFGTYLGNGKGGLKLYDLNKNVNQWTGSKELAREYSGLASKSATYLGFIGYGFIAADYSQSWYMSGGYPGHTKTIQTGADGFMTTWGIWGGPHAISANIGWELGRLITSTQSYQDFRDEVIFNQKPRTGGMDGLLSTDF